MSKNSKLAIEVNEDRMIVMYPDLYKSRTIGLRGILRKITRWLSGRSAEMSVPFYSRGYMQNGR